MAVYFVLVNMFLGILGIAFYEVRNYTILQRIIICRFMNLCVTGMFIFQDSLVRSYCYERKYETKTWLWGLYFKMFSQPSQIWYHFMILLIQSSSLYFFFALFRYALILRQPIVTKYSFSVSQKSRRVTYLKASKLQCKPSSPKVSCIAFLVFDLLSPSFSYIILSNYNE